MTTTTSFADLDSVLELAGVPSDATIERIEWEDDSISIRWR